MPSIPSRKQLTARAALLRQWLGIPGIVLLAAVALDVLAAGFYATSGFSPFLRVTIAIPGTIAFVACALWANRKPLPAALLGAVILVGNTVLIVQFHGFTYAPLIKGISPAETVAGFELVFFTVLREKPARATVAVITLIGSCLAAMAGRTRWWYDSSTDQTVLTSLLFGATILVLAIIAAIYLKRTAIPTKRSLLPRLLTRQWPLITVISLLFFFDIGTGFYSGLRVVPITACSLIAGIAAVLAPEYPGRGALGVTVAICASSFIPTVFGSVRQTNNLIVFGIPLTQIAAGFAVVLFLVRYTKKRTATVRIGALSIVVALATILNASPHRPGLDMSVIRSAATYAALALGITIALGLFLRARDSERAHAVASAVRQAQGAERMALARELHDVVAHHVTGIVVQAQAAKMVSATNQRAASEALDNIEDAGTEALVAMRRLVGSMRGEQDDALHVPNEHATTDLAADLRKVVETAASKDTKIELELSLADEIPHEVSRSALRLVQEALTNIGKHAPRATEVGVEASTSTDELHIKVLDNGDTPNEEPAGGTGGYGLVGMRERVELLQGRLSAGPLASGNGWLVEAWLPLEGVE